MSPTSTPGNIASASILCRFGHAASRDRAAFVVVSPRLSPVSLARVVRVVRATVSRIPRRAFAAPRASSSRVARAPCAEYSMPHTVFVTSIAGGVAPMSRAVVASRDGVVAASARDSWLADSLGFRVDLDGS